MLSKDIRDACYGRLLSVNLERDVDELLHLQFEQDPIYEEEYRGRHHPSALVAVAEAVGDDAASEHRCLRVLVRIELDLPEPRLR